MLTAITLLLTQYFLRPLGSHRQGLDTEILKNGPKKLFGNRLCSKNVVWPWKPNKIRIFVSSPIIGSNWKDIYLFIYLPFHLFVYFIIDSLFFFFWLLLLISSQLRRWKSFASFRSERLFLFSVVKSKPKQRQQGKCGLPSCVLVLVWNLIGQESGANFQDQSKSEVKQERTIFRENYTFKTMCSWGWSTTS